MASKFTKMSLAQLEKHLPLLQSNPCLYQLANLASFKINNRLPNHPSEFYMLESEKNKSKYFYCVLDSLLQDTVKPVFVAGYHQAYEKHADHQNLFCDGLEEVANVDPKLGTISYLHTYSNVADKATSFLCQKYGLEEKNRISTRWFYVNEEQKKFFLELKAQLPEKLTLGKLKVEDAPFVHANWRFSETAESLQHAEAILRLPNACARLDNKLICFEMASYVGHLSHLYTVPEYRGKGIGLIIENYNVKDALETGFFPLKGLLVENKKGFDHPTNKLWTLMMDETGKPTIINSIWLKKKEQL